MPDSNAATPTEGSGPINAPSFQIVKIYLKEASFEQPNSPQILTETASPKTEISIQTSYEKLSGDNYEVLLKASISSRIEDRVVFLVAVEQAGIFELKNIPTDQIDPILEINCPGIILPSLRYNVSDLVNRAGFPPFNLAEINFNSLYQQKLANQQANAGATTPPAA